MKTDENNLFELWFYMGEIYLRKTSVFNLKFTLYFQISFGVYNCWRTELKRVKN